MNAPRRKEELGVVESEYRAVLLDLDHMNEPPLILTASAAAIWWHVDGRNSEQDIVRKVARMFGLRGAEIADEVREFLKDLAQRELIVCY
jgi:hypothetical protein